jgi:hypothetical protein
MQVIYDSDCYAVLQFGGPLAHDGAQPRMRARYEIVDKSVQREIFLDGVLAEHFRLGAEALVRDGVRSPEAFDDYIARFSGLAQHPLALH